jgi:acyl-CoA reductase-like NAD-dependent aldehyde dehydrogenase
MQKLPFPLAPYINGAFRESGKLRSLISPVTEKPCWTVHDTSEELMGMAVNSASIMKRPWAPAPHRRQALLQVASAMEKDIDRASWLESQSGKPVRESREDVEHCIEVLRYYAGSPSFSVSPIIADE